VRYAQIHAVLAQQRVEQRVVGARAVQDLVLARGDHELRHARRDDLRRQLGMGVREREPQRAQHPRGIDLGPNTAGCWSIDGARDTADRQLDVDRLQPGDRLLDVVRLALGARVRVGDRRPSEGCPAKGSSPRWSRCGCGSRRRSRSRSG
jgi:hypothetical protein